MISPMFLSSSFKPLPSPSPVSAAVMWRTVSHSGNGFTYPACPAIFNGLDLSQNTGGGGQGQSGQAVRLFRALRKTSFTLPFLTQIFRP